MPKHFVTNAISVESVYHLIGLVQTQEIVHALI